MAENIWQHSRQRRQPGHWARPHGHSAVRPCVNLFPVLYPHGHSAVLDGRPLQSGHALLSTFFSLFSFSPKKPHCGLSSAMGLLVKKRFAPRCFHALLNALSSPRGALTAVFGMGTGVSPPPVARTKGIGSGRLDPGNGAVRACNIQQAQDGSLRGGFPPPSMLPARALPTGGDRGRAASRPHGLSEAVW